MLEIMKYVTLRPFEGEGYHLFIHLYNNLPLTQSSLVVAGHVKQPRIAQYSWLFKDYR